MLVSGGARDGSVRLAVRNARPAPQVVLVGGGHSHVQVLRRMMMRPWPEARVTVVLDTPVAVYSGMVPGFVAGQYRASELEIDVVPLARLAGAEVVLTPAVGVDPANRRVRLDGRAPLAFDFVSFDIGSTVAGLDLPGVRERARATRPIARLVREIGTLSESFLAHDADRPFELVVAGGGAGGVELAFTVRERLLAAAGGAGIERRLRVTLLQALPEILTGFPASLANRARQNAVARGISIRTGVTVAAVEAGRIRLGSGESVPADSLIWAVGAGSLELFRDSGLPLDDRGFVLTRPTLQTLGDDRIFAVGDCATLQDWPATPKAGVYAVRQGPFVADNLRRVVAGRPLRRYRPQSDFLTLLNLGDGNALGAKWGGSFEGRWVMRLKDRIDRKFMRKFQVLDDDNTTTDEFSRMDRTAMEAMVCGGCAAKAGQTTLDRALGRLRDELGPSPDGGAGRVRLGLDQSDDAAAFATPRGDIVVSSVDWFKAFSGDLWFNGKVAAANALSDLFATGAAPRYAMALVNLPESETDDQRAETLYQVLAGARSLLDARGVSLLGGHTTVGPELTVGFSVEGHPIGERLLTIDGLEVGDGLYLTKRLGSGVVLRGVALGQGRGAWLQEAGAQMVRPNESAARAAVAAGLRAATDVTGFGLMSHLAEMLRASGVSAELDVSALPSLPGAEELLGSGLRSTAHEQNRKIVKAVRVEPGASSDPRFELLFDPQTAGGFLAGVPQEKVGSFGDRLREAGIGVVRIGTVIPRTEDGAVATIRCGSP